MVLKWAFQRECRIPIYMKYSGKRALITRSRSQVQCHILKKGLIDYFWQMYLWDFVCVNKSYIMYIIYILQVLKMVFKIGLLGWNCAWLESQSNLSLKYCDWNCQSLASKLFLNWLSGSEAQSAWTQKDSGGSYSGFHYSRSCSWQSCTLVKVF